MQRLPLLFGLDVVEDLLDDEVVSLAAKSKAAMSDRYYNREKVVLLETAIVELRRFQTYCIDLSGKKSIELVALRLYANYRLSDSSNTSEDTVDLDYDTSPNSEVSLVLRTTSIGVPELEEQTTVVVSDAQGSIPNEIIAEPEEGTTEPLESVQSIQGILYVSKKDKKKKRKDLHSSFDVSNDSQEQVSIYPTAALCRRPVVVAPRHTSRSVQRVIHYVQLSRLQEGKYLLRSIGRYNCNNRSWHSITARHKNSAY